LGRLLIRHHALLRSLPHRQIVKARGAGCDTRVVLAKRGLGGDQVALMLGNLVVEGGFTFRQRDDLMLLFEVDQLAASSVPFFPSALSLGLEEVRCAGGALQAAMFGEVRGGEAFEIVVRFLWSVCHDAYGD